MANVNSITQKQNKVMRLFEDIRRIAKYKLSFNVLEEEVKFYDLDT